MDSRHSAGPKLVFMPTSRPPNHHEDSRMYCVAQGGHSALGEDWVCNFRCAPLCRRYPSAFSSGFPGIGVSQYRSISCFAGLPEVATDSVDIFIDVPDSSQPVLVNLTQQGSKEVNLSHHGLRPEQTFQKET